MQENAWADEWGIVWRHSAEGVGANPVAIPIKDWSQLDDYLRNQMPDADEPGRFCRGAANGRKMAREKYCVGIVHHILFERLVALRGMEDVPEDFTPMRRSSPLVRCLNRLCHRPGRRMGENRYLRPCSSPITWGSRGRADGFTGHVEAVFQGILPEDLR